MERLCKNIVGAAERIIVQQGIEELNLNSLVNDPELKEMDISVVLKKEEDIYILLIDSLDKDIELLLSNSIPGSITPEIELELLFKRAFDLFQKKSWYLSVLFYNSIFEYNERIDQAIKKIKIKVVDYLSRLINRGKKENVFVTTEDTQTLVKDILQGIFFSAVFIYR